MSLLSPLRVMKYSAHVEGNFFPKKKYGEKTYVMMDDLQIHPVTSDLLYIGGSFNIQDIKSK